MLVFFQEVNCHYRVSGSGKSSLINDVLYKGLYRMLYKTKKNRVYSTSSGVENINKLIEISQTRSEERRSNPPLILVFSMILENCMLKLTKRK